MSRQIDLSNLNKLSNDDIAYALSHNMLDKDQRAELGIADEEVRGIIHGIVPDEDLPNTGRAGMRVDPDEYEAFLEYQRQKQEADQPSIGKEGLEAVEVSDDGYEDMRNADLRALIHDKTNGEGDLAGNKEELVARLRELDAEGKE